MLFSRALPLTGRAVWELVCNLTILSLTACFGHLTQVLVFAPISLVYLVSSRYLAEGRSLLDAFHASRPPPDSSAAGHLSPSPPQSIGHTR